MIVIVRLEVKVIIHVNAAENQMLKKCKTCFNLNKIKIKFSLTHLNTNNAVKIQNINVGGICVVVLQRNCFTNIKHKKLLSRLKMSELPL